MQLKNGRCVFPRLGESKRSRRWLADPRLVKWGDLSRLPLSKEAADRRLRACCSDVGARAVTGDLSSTFPVSSEPCRRNWVYLHDEKTREALFRLLVFFCCYSCGQDVYVLSTKVLSLQYPFDGYNSVFALDCQEDTLLGRTNSFSGK